MVPAEDVAALANAMSEQSRMPRLDEIQKAAMHGRVEKFFSLRRQGELVLELYRNLFEAATVTIR
jgi:hypothetical protein